jgi:putative spermidine/putrescine transport system substrate-binding protein
MRSKRFRRMPTALLGASVLALGMLAAACSSSGGSTGTSGRQVPNIPMAKSIGKLEGQLNLVDWAGYVLKPWVTPFEKATGCQVHAVDGTSSDDMVKKMQSGQFDGVSASGDATLRLIYGGQVAPVNTDLVPNYKTVSSFLKNGSWNSVNGQMYGIPHGWGANVLMYNPAVVKGNVDSWNVVFDKSSQYAGKVTAYDSPIYIADAAMYLMTAQPNLGIKDPYSLTETQLDAAINLLKEQNKNIGEYWNDITKEAQSFENGSTVVGTTWQYGANLIASDHKITVKTVQPKEGVTGWSDTWMIYAHAKHPNCMYKWMNWIVSPKANAEVAESFGEAPAQTKACAFTTDKNFCDQYHALDANYASKIYYWTTPQKQCVDGSGDNCTDYSEWVSKWLEVKG